MNFSKVSIERPVGTLILSLMVCVLGIIFLRALPVDLLPRITYPMVRVVINWRGAGPYEIEENIAKKIEASVATTEDAISVVSQSANGNLSLDVYFEYGKDMDIALQDTRAKLDQVRNALPADAEEPIVFKADPTQLPILDIAVFSEKMSDRDLRQWAEDDLSDYFLGIPGLGSVVTSGGALREIQVLFDQERLHQYELSVQHVLTALRNENVDSPAGRITVGDKDFMFRLTAKYDSVPDIGGIIVANREGRSVRLSDVAELRDAQTDQRVYTRLNGTPCVLLSFFKQPNANTVSVAGAIEKRAAELKKKGIVPEHVTLVTAANQAYYVVNAIQNVGTTAAAGGALVVAIIWLFLRDIRRTIVIGVAVPLSILATIVFMGISGLTLNIFSLGGLVLAVGMLLDNSVVMMENISRHQSDGEDPHTAAVVGSNEVFGAVVASTMTNLAAIIPFFFLSGMAALLFRDLVITITIAFIVSLVVSLSVVPMLTARLRKKDSSVSSQSSQWKSAGLLEKLTDGYRVMLQGAMARRWILFTSVTVLIASGVMMFRGLGTEFLPAMDDGKITVRLKLPTGTSLEMTDAIVQRLESIVRDVPGVSTVYAMSGGYWLRKNIYERSNEAEMQVQLVEKNRRPKPTIEVIKLLQQRIKDAQLSKARIRVIKTPLRGIRRTSIADVDVRVQGYDLESLHRIAQEIAEKIALVKGVGTTDLSIDMSEPELRVELDRQKLSDFGLTARMVADTLRTNVYGVVNTKYTDKMKNTDYDIRVVRDPKILTSMRSIEQIGLFPPSGVPVMIKDVARVLVAKGPVQIDRENQVRIISVTANVTGRNVGDVNREIKKILADIVLPEGYVISMGGEAESMRESNRLLLVIVSLAVFLVFVVIAVKFESVRAPVVILTTLPLAFVGSVFLLKVTGVPFGATAFLGLILLVGIVVNNAIVLVEFIAIQRQNKGISVKEAVLAAAPLRLRPILMTSLSTMFGLLPLALGWGEGLEMLRPLAIVIIGGLLSAMVLTLFVIPAAYQTVYGKK